MKSDFRVNGRPVNPLMGIIVSVLFLVALFMLARFFFTVLYYLSPLFLIATLIIDHKVVVNFVKQLVGLIKRNPAMGIGASVLSILGFPIVSAYLLVRASISRRFRQMEKEFEEQRPGEYIDFEETQKENTLDLKRLEERKPVKEKKQNKGSQDNDNDYDQYFD